MEEKQEKRQGGEIVWESAGKKKLENFWFYHKWHLLIGLLVVIVVLVCVLQSRENKNSDVTLLLAGPYRLSATEKTAIEDALGALLPEDYNGDGEKIAETVALTVFSDAQVAEQEAAMNGAVTDASGAVTLPYSGYFSATHNADQIDSFHNLIAAGEYSVCLVDPWLYESVKANGGFRKLSEVCGGAVPAGAIDEYGVRFSETALYKQNPEVFGVLPENTILCLRTQSVMGSVFSHGKTEKLYARSEALFRVMVQP